MLQDTISGAVYIKAFSFALFGEEIKNRAIDAFVQLYNYSAVLLNYMYNYLVVDAEKFLCYALYSYLIN
jgi:hypothetical protein